MFSRWIPPIKYNSLILGPRRVGKTTLLKNQFHDFDYVTLDDFDFLQLAKTDPKSLMNQTSNKLIIDEIQRHPELTITVKKYLDEKQKIFLLTGSNALKLLDQNADTLAARIQIYHLPTCCWGEELGPPTHRIFFDEVPSLKLKEAQRLLDEAMEFGGFPELVTLKEQKEKYELLKKYRDTYFLRDLTQMVNIENTEGLLALLMFIGKAICSEFEISKLGKEIGLSTPTIKKYLNVLYYSDLIFKLYGYQFGPAKRFIKSGKYYFADNGILTSMKIKLSEGQIFENFVLSEIEKRRKIGFYEANELYFYKSVSGAEIDLILELSDEVYAIEIKSSKVIDRRDAKHLFSFSLQSDKHLRKFVLYCGTEYGEIEGVRFIPIASIFRGQ